MKNKLVKIICAAVVSLVAVIPGVNAQAAVTTTGNESRAITDARSLKLSSSIKDKKTQIGGLVNVDLGKLDKVNVSTVDDIKVILENSNIDIDINLINITINKR